MRIAGFLALLVLTAVPATAAAAPPDLAVGHGEQTLTASEFRFDAHEHPKGDFGRMWLRTAAFEVEADVDCLAVLENNATVQGTVTRSEGLEEHDFDELTFLVTDNGKEDNFQYVVAEEGQELCAPFGAILPIDRGNIVVKDGGP